MVGKNTREERQHILSRDDPCGSLLENLSLNFLGQFTREEEVAEKQFLQNKCYDVRKMEEYYLEQERLYYTFHKTSDTIHKTFVLSMPGPVAEMMEAKLKADAIVDLSVLSIAQLYQMAMELIQSHCRSQDLRKHIKNIENPSLQKFCNEEPNKFGCQHTDRMCSCNTSKRRKEKRPWKPYKGKKYRFIKRRKQKGSGRCFICGKKGHCAKQCKSKKRLPVKLLQMIQQEDFDDEIYTWSDSPLGVVYTLDDNPLSDIEGDDTTTSTDSSSEEEASILVVKEPL